MINTVDAQKIRDRFFSIPRAAFVSITGVCDLKCTYCISPNINQCAHMSEADYSIILERLRSGGVISITITGGEPTLHPFFDKIINDFMKFAKVQLLTNGQFNEERLAFFRSLNNPSQLSVSISLDGYDQTTCEATRKNSDFGRIVKNIQSLLQKGYRVAINTTVTRELTIPKIKIMGDFLRSLHVSSWHLLPLCPPNNDPDLWNSLRTSQEVIEFIHQYCDQNSDFVKTGFSSFAAHKKGDNRDNKIIPCGVAKESISIGYNGDVFPCNFWNQKVGSLLTDSIKDIYYNSELLNQIKRIRDIPVSELPSCKHCPDNDSCSGGCRAMAYSYYGTPLMKDPYCNKSSY